MRNFDTHKWVSRAKSAFYYLTSKGKAGWNWYKHLYQRSPWYKKTLIVVLTFIASFIIYLGMVDVNFLWLFGKSPGLSSIHNPDQPIASEIYSEDGKLIGKFFRENRSPVKYEEISPVLIKTLISTEDERFYEHFGVDLQGVFSAVKDMAGGKARGASTITQQLVKNLFLSQEQTMGRKAEEFVLAMDMELNYSKDEILELYLNTIYVASGY